MRKIISILVGLAVCLVASAQGSVRVQAPNLVGVGEKFNVTVTVEGSDKAEAPEWEPGSDFLISWGPHPYGSSTSISIVNGKKTESRAATYVYVVVAKNKGNFTLPPVSAKIGGTKYSSNPIHIEVATDPSGAAQQQQSAGQQSQGQVDEDRQTQSAPSADAFLRFVISKNKVYVGEPVKATLKLYTKADIAGFEEVKFPTFNGFWSQETFAPKNIEFQRENVGGNIYLSAVLREYTLIPQQSGSVDIDPAEITCVMRVNSASRGMGSIFDSFFEEYQTVRRKAVSSGYKVQVMPLPSGAPASFCGAVGEYGISASLASDSLKAHEASSLIVTVRGSGNIMLAEAPKLNFPPDFDVYDVKTTDQIDRGSLSGSRTFEYPFIPRSAGDFTIGPIEYSYFNYRTGQYVTVKSEALDLSVQKGKEGDASSAPQSGLQNMSKKDVKDLGTDIRYISIAEQNFSRKGRLFAASGWYFGILALLLALGAGVFIALRSSLSKKADVAFTKRRSATKMARKRLAVAGTFLEKQMCASFFEELHKALTGFASDKLNMDVTELTKENIASAFVSAGVDDGTATEFASLLDACEYARYSPDQSGEAMSEKYASAVEVISIIDSAMKNNGRKGGAAVAAVLALLMFCAPSAFAMDSASADSLWNAGIQAYSEGNAAGALEAWSGIESAGLESAELYANIGDAHFRLSSLGKAVLYYEKALKLDPSYQDARHNLEFANAQITDKVKDLPGFFLKNWTRGFANIFSADAWAVFSLVLLALALAAVIVFLLIRDIRWRKAGFASGITALVLFLICFGMMLSQRTLYLAEDEAVVVQPVCVAKSSPANDASNLFVLHEGTKVDVLERAGDWMEIQLSDGRKAWVEATEIEII